MKVKTLTGSSIHQALQEARRLLGDDVVLLESIPAHEDSPARITVMIDAPSKLEEKSSTNKAITVEQAPRRSYGYAQTVNAAAEGNEHTPPTQSPFFSPPEESYTMVHRRGEGFVQRRKPRSGGLFSRQAAERDQQMPAPTQRVEEILERQLNLLHDRIDDLNRRFEGAIIGGSHRWTGHILFSRLLNQGLRAQTITRLFEGIVERGHEPDDSPSKIRWALAQELRDLLHITTPKAYTGTILFMGPSGSGKTSLLLKLATHPSFFGRRRAMAISIMPSTERGLPYNNPAHIFQHYGIPVLSVRSAEDMEKALQQAEEFEQVLIDTPPLAAHEGSARKMLHNIKQLIEPVMPIQVQLVLNATRALEEFDTRYLDYLPIKPDVLALTHLDETRNWGRVAEWMMELKLPVQFASSSAKVPDGVGSFSPSWFVEELTKLL